MEKQPIDHEDLIAGMWFNSLSHYNLAHKFFPLLQAMKVPDAKAAVARKTAVMANDESQEQKRGH